MSCYSNTIGDCDCDPGVIPQRITSHCHKPYSGFYGFRDYRNGGDGVLCDGCEQKYLTLDVEMTCLTQALDAGTGEVDEEWTGSASQRFTIDRYTANPMTYNGSYSGTINDLNRVLGYMPTVMSYAHINPIGNTPDLTPGGLFWGGMATGAWGDGTIEWIDLSEEPADVQDLDCDYLKVVHVVNANRYPLMLGQRIKLTITYEYTLSDPYTISDLASDMETLEQTVSLARLRQMGKTVDGFTESEAGYCDGGGIWVVDKIGGYWTPHDPLPYPASIEGVTWDPGVDNGHGDAEYLLNPGFSDAGDYNVTSDTAHERKTIIPYSNETLYESNAYEWDTCELRGTSPISTEEFDGYQELVCQPGEVLHLTEVTE